MNGPVLVLRTSPRVAPGQLSAAAWDVLRGADVRCPADGHRQRDALVAAGVEVTPLDVGAAALAAEAMREPAEALREAAEASDRPVVWLAGPDGDPALVDALDAEVVVVVGSVDLPGARLLDVVAVMDRLRSPGGCPWDAQQTHDSLAPYLLEEAYEAYQALEDGDLDALREELGDVLLQVAFHARLAQEEAGWSVDDVAAGLVDKLVRRHPHVFGDASVDGAADVEASWDTIKATEKKRTSVTDGVPLAQPALALAAQLQRRATRAGLPETLVSPLLESAATPAHAVAAAAADLVDGDVPPTVDRVGDLLFAAVALARSAGVDPEAALRGSARRFRDRLAGVEAETRAGGRDPADLDAVAWAELWDADGRADADLDEAAAAAEAEPD